jgi:hypothetical protein
MTNDEFLDYAGTAWENDPGLVAGAVLEDADAPVTAGEMAQMMQQVVNLVMNNDIAEFPHGDSFEITAPATGQQFRVTVTEIPAS